MMIKIDTREKKLIEILRNKDIDIEVTQLEIGDIHIHNEYSCIVIERKTIVDALASINDGRYREQKTRLLSVEGITPLYIIENDTFVSNNVKLSGMYTNTMLRDRISIIFTNGVDETGNTIIHLLEQMRNKPNRLCNGSNNMYVSCVKAKSKKIDNIDKKTCFILQLSQIPMISNKIANEIANKHASMKDFVNCLSEWDNPIEYLVTFDGIGKSKAENIISYLL